MIKARLGLLLKTSVPLSKMKTVEKKTLESKAVFNIFTLYQIPE